MFSLSYYFKNWSSVEIAYLTRQGVFWNDLLLLQMGVIRNLLSRWLPTTALVKNYQIYNSRHSSYSVPTLFSQIRLDDLGNYLRVVILHSPLIHLNQIRNLNHFEFYKLKRKRLISSLVLLNKFINFPWIIKNNIICKIHEMVQW